MDYMNNPVLREHVDPVLQRISLEETGEHVRNHLPEYGIIACLGGLKGLIDHNEWQQNPLMRHVDDFFTPRSLRRGKRRLVYEFSFGILAGFLAHTKQQYLKILSLKRQDPKKALNAYMVMSIQKTVEQAMARERRL